MSRPEGVKCENCCYGGDRIVFSPQRVLPFPGDAGEALEIPGREEILCHRFPRVERHHPEFGCGEFRAEWPE